MQAPIKTKAPTPPPADALATWRKNIELALRVLRSPGDWLQIPPGTGPLPDDALHLLLEARAAFRASEAMEAPAMEAAKALAAACCGDARKDALHDIALAAINGIDVAVAAELKRGRRSAQVVRVADFGSFRTIGTPSGEGRTATLYVGVVDGLDRAHPAYARLPTSPGDLYQLDLPHDAGEDTLGKAGLVLGPQLGAVTHPSGQPRPWYLLDDALRWTETMRHRQRQQLAERREQARRDDLKARQEWWASPLGQEERKRRALEKLRAAGQIPEFAEAPPTIRGGGIR